jgi:uncharacterized integral membrane protein
MNFLKTLLWILIAAALAIFATANWTDATLKLWGGLLLTIKLPFLLLLAFLVGWLPTWLIMRGKLWRVKRLGADGHSGTLVPPPPQASVAEEPAEERP